jgi:hypothetical protein
LPTIARALSGAILSVLLSLLPLTASGQPSASALSIRIVGNHFVDGTGTTIRLLGVNRSGTEDECVAGNGIFDGPSDETSIAAMASWHINAVRVPLNEDCWLGINGVAPAFSGLSYQQAIEGYVGRLHDAGLYAILDLHWNAQGGLEATTGNGQGRQMADADHSPTFWHSVATAFRDDPATVFDLYNEPHDISWDCWQRGCQTSDATGSWRVAGFQSLIDAVRSTGARNPILVPGNRWAGDLRGWPHGLVDAAHQLAASWHVYAPPGTRLDALKDFVVRPILAGYPVVAAEIGEKDCAHQWLDSFTNWADGVGISYLAWTWDTWPDCTNPVLITAYDGTPTPYGVGYFDHLTTLWRDHAGPSVLSPIGAFAPMIFAGIGGIALVILVVNFGFFTLRRLRTRRRPLTVTTM